MTLDASVTTVRPVLLDPFADDAADDAAVGTTSRGLTRLAIVATRAGAAFEREGLDVDPAAWLQAPRSVFGGKSALSACLSRRDFERAIALLACGAELGLDADPMVVDDLIEDDEAIGAHVPAPVDAIASAQPRHDPLPPPYWRTQPQDGSSRRCSTGERLYCSGFVRYDAGGRVLCFVAAVVEDEREFRNRLFARFGAIAALGARVVDAFDRYDRFACRLVSEASADLLECLSAAPEGATLEGFSYLAEQRA